MRAQVLWFCALMGVCPVALAAPPPPGTPPLDPRDDRVQRKAIRGGPVDLSRESPELRELREFEQATFPRAGMRPATPADGPVPGRPGLPDDTPRRGRGLSPEDPPDVLRSPQPGEVAPDESGSPPRPAIPWLSSLRLLDNLGLSA